MRLVLLAASLALATSLRVPSKRATPPPRRAGDSRRLRVVAGDADDGGVDKTVREIVGASMYGAQGEVAAKALELAERAAAAEAMADVAASATEAAAGEAVRLVERAAGLERAAREEAAALAKRVEAADGRAADVQRRLEQTEAALAELEAQRKEYLAEREAEVACGADESRPLFKSRRDAGGSGAVGGGARRRRGVPRE